MSFNKISFANVGSPFQNVNANLENVGSPLHATYGCISLNNVGNPFANFESLE